MSWDALVDFQHVLAEEMVTDGTVLSMYTAPVDVELGSPPAVIITSYEPVAVALEA
jgi:hypothetical protein